MRPPNVDLQPPRRFQPRPLLWLGWATTCTALLGASAWALATQITVLPTQHHLGAFESRISSVPLVLPAGLPIESVLAQDGDQVQAGQRLASFDLKALERRREELTNRLSLNRTHRQCLLHKTPKAPLSDRPIIEDAQSEPLRPDPAPLALRRDSTLLRCHNRHRLNQLARERLQHKRESLRRKTALSVQELLARAALAPSAFRPVLTLRAASEKEALASATREIEFDLAELKESQSEALWREIDALEMEALDIEAQLTQLNSYAENPWLLSPGTGRIHRLRKLDLTNPPQSGLVLAQILQPQDREFLITVDIPRAQAALMDVGDPLPIRLSGMGHVASQIAGTIEEISPGWDPSTDNALVQLALPRASLNIELLRLLDTVPDGARSSVEVSLPARKLGDILSGSVQATLTQF